MLNWILSKTIGTKNQREVRKLSQIAQQVNLKEEEYQKLWRGVVGSLRMGQFELDSRRAPVAQYLGTDICRPSTLCRGMSMAISN